MEFKEFIDRKSEVARLRNALEREDTQFIAIYGRRRIGKSTLIKQVIQLADKNIYFLSDTTEEINQRMLFAKTAALKIEDFDKVVYPDWETLLRALNRQIPERTIVCLDEFPYLVDSCHSLPSVIQKLLNEKVLRFDLIICGSSQKSMCGLLLDKKSPIYGMANEVIKLEPITAGYTIEALGVDASRAVEEYSVWGGIPRYWELRRDYSDLKSAIKNLILDTQGILNDEPQRLLKDDMRDTVQAITLLSIIGNGANRISEIGSRAGKEAGTITEPLAKLRDLGFVEREVPFGESFEKSKKGLYHIKDNLINFLYRFVIPYQSVLELGRFDTVMNMIKNQFSQYVGFCWEKLCRNYVSGNTVGGITYKAASRWWGKIFPEGSKEGEMRELDVVAESFDKKHLLIGECKWTKEEDTERLKKKLQESIPYLPFIKRGQKVHIVLFLKELPLHQNGNCVFLPKDILS
ncbi:MAG: ATP-binding protein [Prevotella sp.]|jgi:AAA+ ATPase superfamily predicted ATPase|nr:ATP-binding protein [Prevotella sp.]MCH4183731.1 ATP-binding protein [Prevotella sp.]